MSEGNIEPKEQRLQAGYYPNQFEFAIGYTYSEFERWPHLLHASFMFWEIDFAW